MRVGTNWEQNQVLVDENVVRTKLSNITYKQLVMYPMHSIRAPRRLELLGEGADQVELGDGERVVGGGLVVDALNVPVFNFI